MNSDSDKLSKFKLVPATFECEDCNSVVHTQVPEGLPRFRATRCESCVKLLLATEKKQTLHDLRRGSIVASGIPAKYFVHSPDKARELGTGWLLDWILRRGKQSIWVEGLNGIGKTHTTHHAAYQRILQYDESVRVIRCSSWLLDVALLRSGNDEEKRQSRNMVKDLQTADLVVLDDLGKETLTRARTELLWDIVDIRDRQDKRIWITTNNGANHLAGRLDSDFSTSIITRLTRMVPPKNVINEEGVQ